jgi:DNA-binding MarR family transcriptional regulator
MQVTYLEFMDDAGKLRIALDRVVRWYQALTNEAGAGLSARELRTLELLAGKVSKENKSVARQVGLTESAASRMLKGLESQGFVSRSRVYRSKETYNSITVAGTEVLRGTREGIDQRLRSATGGKSAHAIDPTFLAAALEHLVKAEERAQIEAKRLAWKGREASWVDDPDLPF